MDWLDEKLNCWSAEKDASWHCRFCIETVVMNCQVILLCHWPSFCSVQCIKTLSMRTCSEVSLHFLQFLHASDICGFVTHHDCLLVTACGSLIATRCSACHCIACSWTYYGSQKGGGDGVVVDFVGWGYFYGYMVLLSWCITKYNGSAVSTVHGDNLRCVSQHLMQSSN